MRRLLLWFCFFRDSATIQSESHNRRCEHFSMKFFQQFFKTHFRLAFSVKTIQIGTIQSEPKIFVNFFFRCSPIFEKKIPVKNCKSVEESKKIRVRVRVSTTPPDLDPSSAAICEESAAVWPSDDWQFIPANVRPIETVSIPATTSRYRPRG